MNIFQCSLMYSEILQSDGIKAASMIDSLASIALEDSKRAYHMHGPNLLAGVHSVLPSRSELSCSIKIFGGNGYHKVFVRFTCSLHRSESHTTGDLVVPALCSFNDSWDVSLRHSYTAQRSLEPWFAEILVWTPVMFSGTWCAADDLHAAVTTKLAPFSFFAVGMTNAVRVLLVETVAANCAFAKLVFPECQRFLHRQSTGLQVESKL
mmetsp:Transcript_6360/g.19223  ORF Transcript_6360/g.19223 Transcript_6360/m.19223 type:complete len:208 (+) Transcript_6360:1418-2041(+)